MMMNDDEIEMIDFDLMMVVASSLRTTMMKQ